MLPQAFARDAGNHVLWRLCAARCEHQPRWWRSRSWVARRQRVVLPVPCVRKRRRRRHDKHRRPPASSRVPPSAPSVPARALRVRSSRFDIVILKGRLRRAGSPLGSGAPSARTARFARWTRGPNTAPRSDLALREDDFEAEVLGRRVPAAGPPRVSDRGPPPRSKCSGGMFRAPPRWPRTERWNAAPNRRRCDRAVRRFRDGRALHRAAGC